MRDLCKEINQVADEVETWISQTIAHEVKEHRRSKEPPMEGNITNAADVCIKAIRRIVQLLADVEPVPARIPAAWQFPSSPREEAFSLCWFVEIFH